ncbi:MAG: dihydropteroate synthase [Chlorobi bacterium]|nr:dihydropteroate synthase [Chlorobiota bacterium]
MDRNDFPTIVGIINVTPDSFSDGGQYRDTQHACEHAVRLVAEGAGMLDVGGESSRPGADPVPADEEIQRVVPVIHAIRQAGVEVPISIDTVKATVAQAALDAGATIVNDISAGMHDPDMFPLVAQRQVPIVVMHMRGTPRTMQLDPRYDNVVEDVYAFLSERIEVATGFGIEHIIADVGIGFGKTLEHNLALLANLRRFASLGVPLMLGISRKRFLGVLTGIETPSERDSVTALMHALLLSEPITYARVHNVRLLAQLRSLWTSLKDYTRIVQ